MRREDLNPGCSSQKFKKCILRVCLRSTYFAEIEIFFAESTIEEGKS